MKNENINFNDFLKVFMACGTIIEAQDFPEARKKAYKITVDFGEHGIKKTSAQITDLYSKEELIGKQILGVINFPKKQIGPFMSEFLLTGFHRKDGKVVIASPEQKIENGARLA